MILEPVPEVSVILPTCDRPKLIGRALASLLGQEFRDLEILLVDANRHHAPVRQNSALADLLQDSRVHVVDGRGTRNAAMARNVGLQAARGRWISFLDDDDEYDQEKIAAQHACAQATGAAFILCGYELVWPERRRQRQIDRPSFHGDEILTHATLGSPMLFHRRDDAVRFDERLNAGEDMPYALAFVRQHGIHEVPCVPRALIRVSQSSDGRSVHSNKEALWQAYRTSAWLARPTFSREARHAFLARGMIERARGGHGGIGYFARSVRAVLHTRGSRKWRLAAYSILARLRELNA